MEDIDNERCSSSLSFTVDFADCGERKSKIPSRFLKYENGQNIKSTEDLKLKQDKAEQRRKAYEKAKIERIKERNEECRKIDSKVQILLAQDAKRKGIPGTDNVKPMSSREVTQSLKSLVKDFSKITKDLKSDNVPP